MLKRFLAVLIMTAVMCQIFAFLPVFSENTADTPHLSIVCEELGQAFWGKDIEFGIKVSNTTGTAVTYDVTAELINDLKEKEFTKSDTVELAAGESKTLNYSTSLSRYAVYELNVTSVRNGLSERSTLSTELVTLKKSESQNQKLGIIDHSADKGDGYGRFDEKLEYIKNMGMSAIRTELPWAHYEETQNTYKIRENYKKVYDSAKKHNLDILLIMGWNNKNLGVTAMPPNSENDLALFGKYVYNMAGDTKDYAYGYEAWNEWNVKEQFNTEGLTGAQYVPFIKNIYENVEKAKKENKANPNAKVYGLSGLTWNRNDVNRYGQYAYQTMATEMFKNGVADYCDGFSMHPYAHQGSPDDGISLECIEFTRGLMKEYGAEDKELIITEMGWQAENEYYPYYDEENIASWVAKYSAMVYDKVDKMYWYCSQRKIRDVGAGEQSYGWMQDENEEADYVPYAPLPQMRAMANYNSYIADATGKQEIDAGDNVTMYRFNKADGSDVVMAWVKDEFNKATQKFITSTETCELSLDGEYAIVSDLYGNETEYELNDGKFTLTLTNEPQYIKAGYRNTSGSDKLWVSVMNAQGKIYVRGNIGAANEKLAFKVKKNDEICYLNQIKSNANGDYTLTFPLNKEYGVYNLSVGTLDKGKESISFSFDIKAFDIEVLKDGQPIDNADDLKKGDVLTVNTTQNIEADNASIIAAQYNQYGRLVDVSIVPCDDDVPMEIEIKKDDVDKIRIYIWSIADIAPLNGAVTL